MSAPHTFTNVPVADLRPGLYVQLDLSWVDHPFPTGKFLIKTSEQLVQLRALGLAQVKVCVERSDPAALAALPRRTVPEPATPAAAEATPRIAPEAAPRLAAVPAAQDARARHRQLLAAQQSSLAHSQKMHTKAVNGWMAVMQDVIKSPAAAGEAAAALSGEMVGELRGATDPTIRVLSEAAGTGSVQHAINVTVLALMLGRRMGWNDPQLAEVAQGALLHDIGRLLLPPMLRQVSDDDTALKARERREHVSQGLRLGMAMGLPQPVLQVIAQHHELVDGSGVPKGLKTVDIAPSARLVALVDRYDRLCNPVQGGAGRTPHEAQALIYAQMRGQFDDAMLTAFIRLVGVYPPGSVVQLADDRHAIVVSAHPQQPLRPCVLVHDPAVPRDEALLLDLARTPGLGIRRSLHPQHLSRATLDYLQPGTRTHYYFADEPSAEPLEALA